MIEYCLLSNVTIKGYVELAWRSGCVMDCHATARGSIPGGKGVKTVNGSAVSKRPRCRWDVKHNQHNQQLKGYQKSGLESDSYTSSDGLLSGDS